MLSKPLIISKWDGGIADSPYEGIANSYAAIVGLDYRTFPGILQIERPMAKVSGQSGGSDVVQGILKWFVNISPSEIYGLVDNQSVADRTDIVNSADTGATWSLLQSLGNSDSPFSANGGIFWKGYFLFCSDGYLGYYKPNSSGSKWVQSWQSLKVNGVSDSDWHPMMQGERDGALYIGNRSFIAQLTETATTVFNPENSATFSFTKNALDITSDFRVKSLAEVGDFLMLGCWKNTL